MEPETLSILCDPITHEPFTLISEQVPGGDHSEVLVGQKSGVRYPVKDGIPEFVSSSEITGLNKKFQRFYDWFAFIYDPAVDLSSRILAHAGDIDLRRQYLTSIWGKDSILEIGEDMKILEVSIGTGHNILAFPKMGRYYGLDISRGMLTRCRRNMRKYGRRTELFQGNAEQLPFIDACFDIVFHVGGINFFSNKAKAIGEMIRVARPGTKLAIIDETERVIKRASFIPLSGRYFGGKEKLAAVPVDLVPKIMQDIKVDYILNGRMYVLTFIKPLSL